jgi:tetratricopeptide (TPR) repeat protein
LFFYTLWFNVLLHGLLRTARPASLPRIIIERLIMPESPDRDIADARARFRRGEADAAGKTFERVLASDPCNVAALHGLGLCLHASGRRDRAINTFQQAVALDPSAWTSWQSIADLTPDETERRLAIDQAADILLAASQAGPPSPRIIRTAVRALVCAGRSQQALRLLHEQSCHFDDEAQAHVLLAGTYYSLGQFEAATHHQYLALPQAPAVPPTSGKSCFEPSHAMSALLELYSLLEAGGFRPFLVAGTLLGLVRSGNLIVHDRDIDIGLVRGDNGARDPVDFIRTHPALLLPHSARPGDRYVGLIVDGIAADIFVFDQTPSGMVCGFSDMPGDIQWCHTPFRLRRMRLGGYNFHIPDPTETYLAECYGPDWRVPDDGFASALSSPALHGTSPHAIAYLALVRARTCRLAGNPEKAEALLQKLPQLGAAGARSTTCTIGQTTPAINRQAR